MFRPFADSVQKRFEEMSRGELFTVDVADVFDQYLAAFPEGTNPVYKVRTTHDCQCCKQFVRRLGTLVSLKGGVVHTVWAGYRLDSFYQDVADKMSEIVKAAPITGVFRTKEKGFGTHHNYDKDNVCHDHFFCEVAAQHRTSTPDATIGEFHSIFQVFKRGLTRLRDEDFGTVLDLIDSNALYRGEEHKPALLAFRKLFRAFDGSDRYIWANIHDRSARFRNTVIGTLLVDLAEGKDVDVAVRQFEQKVAPANYKRTTSIITQKMVEEAVQKLTDLGLGGAIYRRFARLSDVSVNDVLFVDNSVQGKMKDGVAALLENDVKKRTTIVPGRATQIAAEEFLSGVLPGAKSVDVLVENRHSGNFVSLTGSDGPERLFKWNNNFAWSYDGDVTDSVKQRVKAAGGNINADLRISLSWFNFDDLDLHAVCPFGHVYYGNPGGGDFRTRILDVDMNAGHGTTKTPVENLAFNNLRDGVYKIHVHQYARRETVDFGFAIEFEFGGQLRQFSHNKATNTGTNVPCFDIEVVRGQVTNVVTHLPEGTSSQEKWGVKTETLVPVTAIMHSPNHWNGEKAGAKHLIFALQGCKNPEPTRGIYNEFLRPEFEKHRKVFEVLGSRTKCQPTDDQISGVGFTAARGDSVCVVVDGKRAYNVTF